MFKGFYTVATGMITQQRRTELLSNNLANANTPGFKADQSTIRSFPDMLMSSIGKTNAPANQQAGAEYMNQVGALNTGTYLQETLPNYIQGQIYSTDFTTDMALIDGNLPQNEEGVSGSIFFRLAHPDGGEAYTRNGNFTLDGQGYLVNGQGLYVLNDVGQRIQLPNDDFRLDESGAIYINNQQVARVGVSYAANPNMLQKQDNGLIRTENGVNLPSAYGANGVSFTLRQNFLEGSNVDSGRAMTDLMTAYRAFEANQKVLQAYDRSMEKAVNEIGKI
ncbi:flagellar hook-basal body protein [Lysinibacillus sp. FSL R7-0073]|uniref:Flagellar biosynthesis protein FlgG n=1 Tax=Lysinibacillus fusiformis TaxID=28031 RepID=A0A1E4R2S8_9BACI|nr:MULTISPECIES: flagellar hook-basal body protein [Lysinibacillus]HBJ01877.1 flagellar hook-basal body protein [Lysinibacillus sp.]MBD8519520.1 flagellar hook-basal body protein [Lysinibacillus fusiformis]MCR8854656.1 flagellar hook-basal body protein [Lysinibacillus fusiformis]MED4889269.1 flagellar hook-basal body protein [Lysinibacillus fusiformis]ODV54766.1 flagellar biosynthesis protein FlgG [Lysinibacillus fusiformis]